MGRCYCCERSIDHGLRDVVLLCMCSTSICEDCARCRIAIQPNTWAEGLQCPVCLESFTLLGTENADASLGEYLMRLADSLGIHHSKFDGALSSVKKTLLLMCLAKLRHDAMYSVYVSELSEESNVNVLSLQLARIQALRQQEALPGIKLEQLPENSTQSEWTNKLEQFSLLPYGPLNRIQLVVALRVVENNNDFCLACGSCFSKDLVATTGTRCSCPYATCSYCRLSSIACMNQQTYFYLDEKDACMQCRVAPLAPWKNIRKVLSVENKLIESALAHYRLRNIPNTNTELKLFQPVVKKGAVFDVLLECIRCFARDALFRRTDWEEDASGANSSRDKLAMIPRFRLLVATLEVKRLIMAEEIELPQCKSFFSKPENMPLGPVLLLDFPRKHHLDEELKRMRLVQNVKYNSWDEDEFEKQAETKREHERELTALRSNNLLSFSACDKYSICVPGCGFLCPVCEDRPSTRDGSVLFQSQPEEILLKNFEYFQEHMFKHHSDVSLPVESLAVMRINQCPICNFLFMGSTCSKCTSARHKAGKSNKKVVQNPRHLLTNETYPTSLELGTLSAQAQQDNLIEHVLFSSIPNHAVREEGVSSILGDNFLARFASTTQPALAVAPERIFMHNGTAQSITTPTRVNADLIDVSGSEDVFQDVQMQDQPKYDHFVFPRRGRTGQVQSESGVSRIRFIDKFSIHSIRGNGLGGIVGLHSGVRRGIAIGVLLPVSPEINSGSRIAQSAPVEIQFDAWLINGRSYQEHSDHKKFQGVMLLAKDNRGEIIGYILKAPAPYFARLHVELKPFVEAYLQFHSRLEAFATELNSDSPLGPIFHGDTDWNEALPFLGPELCNQLITKWAVDCFANSMRYSYVKGQFDTSAIRQMQKNVSMLRRIAAESGTGVGAAPEITSIEDDDDNAVSQGNPVGNENGEMGNWDAHNGNYSQLISSDGQVATHGTSSDSVSQVQMSTFEPISGAQTLDYQSSIAVDRMDDLAPYGNEELAEAQSSTSTDQQVTLSPEVEEDDVDSEFGAVEEWDDEINSLIEPFNSSSFGFDTIDDSNYAAEQEFPPLMIIREWSNPYKNEEIDNRHRQFFDRCNMKRFDNFILWVKVDDWLPIELSRAVCARHGHKPLYLTLRVYYDLDQDKFRDCDMEFPRIKNKLKSIRAKIVNFGIDIDEPGKKLFCKSYRGFRLQDTRSFADYNLTSGSIVHLLPASFGPPKALLKQNFDETPKMESLPETSNKDGEVLPSGLGVDSSVLAARRAGVLGQYHAKTVSVQPRVFKRRKGAILSSESESDSESDGVPESQMHVKKEPYQSADSPLTAMVDVKVEVHGSSSRTSDNVYIKTEPGLLASNPQLASSSSATIPETFRSIKREIKLEGSDNATRGQISNDVIEHKEDSSESAFGGKYSELSYQRHGTIGSNDSKYDRYKPRDRDGNWGGDRNWDRDRDRDRGRDRGMDKHDRMLAIYGGNQGAPAVPSFAAVARANQDSAYDAYHPESAAYRNRPGNVWVRPVAKKQKKAKSYDDDDEFSGEVCG